MSCVLIRLGVLCLGLAIAGCGAGRVRAGQGTEVRQEEVYEPATKVAPPEGNSMRRTETYPVIEVELDRKTDPTEPEPPEPE